MTAPATPHPPSTVERAMDQRHQLIDLLVDLSHPALLPRDVRLLQRLYRLRGSYMQRGRGREAHAVGYAMTVTWHTMVHPDQPLPASQPMRLELDLDTRPGA